jgi:hypothetical protein
MIGAFIVNLVISFEMKDMNKLAVFIGARCIVTEEKKRESLTDMKIVLI